MRRRDFLAMMGAAAGGFTAPSGAAAKPGAEAQAQPRDIYPDVLQAAEQQIPELLPRQQPDGGLLWEFDLPLAHATAGFIRDTAAVYLAPDSRYHRSADLLPRVVRAAKQLRSIQNSDGTIDLPTTNFGSPPDTGFVLEIVCVTATVLRARAYAETRELQAELEGFIRAAAESQVTGGVHTPNHRWVMVSALARCHSLFPDQRFLARIDEWLAEGVDIDRHNHYTERSTGVYNWVTDDHLMIAGRLLKRPELFEPVRRNLEEMLYFVRSDGEVVTDISRRQDRFQPATMRQYYRPYRWMSHHDGNGRFAAMADAIERDHALQLGGELIYFLESPELRNDPTPRLPLPQDYERSYPLYDFARIRRGPRDATILGGHSRLFSYRDGAVVEAVRLASAFFGKGQFVAPLERVADGYRMQQELEADYLQPLQPELRRPDGDWLAVPREKRARSNIFRLRSIVDIRETKVGFALAMDVQGTNRVPVAVEITLRPGGQLTGHGLAPVPNFSSAQFLLDGYATYEQAGRRIRLGPGVRHHGWTQLRGAEPRVEGESLYLTGFTPFRHTLEITSG
jgi:hypothetical protein